MASSGSTSVNFTKWDDLKFSWWIDSQSIENNTTTIGWKMELVSGQYGQIVASSQSPWEITVNGTTYTGKENLGVANNATKTLASGSTTIPHNEDGSKSFSYSFSQTMHITFSGAYISTVSGSGSGTLDTIPRASDFTISEGTLGVAQTITVKRQTTAFTHGLTYSCGNVSTQLICAWNTATESVPFTPPIDLAWQAVNGTRVWVSVHLQTYDSGGTPIGSTVTKGVWMTIPESVKPSCSIAVSDPTGYASKYGAYIQGQSKLAIKVTPTPAYGSSITSGVILADGNKYTALEATTPAVQSTGSLEVYADVTDTRGRLGSASAKVTVLPYTKPIITKLAVHRCNKDGTENGSGLCVKVTYSYTVDSLSNLNGMSGYVQYKKSTESNYTSVAIPERFSVENGTVIFDADDASSYDVQLIIADSFVSVSRKTAASTAFTLIHYSPSGKGMSIGGINNGEGFRIFNMPFYIENVEVDYIVEQGESDGWFYRKWNSGYAECWKVYYGYGINSAKNNYSGFYYSETILVPFPFAFTNLPTVTVDGGSSSYMNFVRSFGKYSDKASFMVVSMVNAGNVDVTVDIKAIGKWK